MAVSPSPVGRGEKPQHDDQRADQRLLRRFRNEMRGAPVVGRSADRKDCVADVSADGHTSTAVGFFNDYSGRIAIRDALAKLHKIFSDYRTFFPTVLIVRAHLIFTGETLSPCGRNQGVCRMSKLVAFLKNEKGATAIEYGLIAAGISVAIIAVVNGLGTTLNDKFNSISTQLH